MIFISDIYHALKKNITIYRTMCMLTYIYIEPTYTCTHIHMHSLTHIQPHTPSTYPHTLIDLQPLTPLSHTHIFSKTSPTFTNSHTQICHYRSPRAVHTHSHPYSPTLAHTQIFTGNSDRNTAQTNNLWTTLTARYVRYLPLEGAQGNNKCMRADVIGCLDSDQQ